MKVFLMYKDRDFNPEQELPPHSEELMQDLELNTILDAMAQEDKFLFDISKTALLSSLTERQEIQYRQNILKDCLDNSVLIRDLYEIAVKAIESEKKIYFGLLSKYPDIILSRSIKVLTIFINLLKQLRQIADDHSSQFKSEGFSAFFSMLQKELSDEYFATMQYHLKTLRLRGGVLISARLGEGNKGAGYTLRKPKEKDKKWIKHIFDKKPPSFTYTLSERDESGARALSDIRDRGLNAAANALAQSTDHILSFFSALRNELAFYVGCLNIYEELAGFGASLCFPTPLPLTERNQSIEDLYDASLALQMKEKISGNNLKADQIYLVIITGANRGGKSTFLRSIGTAQLMMQSGIFVPAKSFTSHMSEGIFTHFKREEDSTMDSGKLDEELKRMNDIMDSISPHSMLLFNESFAATNEREGSEIARQIINALKEKGIKVFFVTHLYDFAHSIYLQKTKKILFLRAERQSDTKRTFRILEGEPLQTSFGDDVYAQIFKT